MNVQRKPSQYLILLKTSILILQNATGHEATGVVVEVGDDVTELSIGSRIAIENHFYCGDCYTCKV